MNNALKTLIKILTLGFIDLPKSKSIIKEPLRAPSNNVEKKVTVLDKYSGDAWQPATQTYNTIDYYSYIVSDKWVLNPARLEVLTKDDYICRMCGSNHNIQVHHITYKNLGNEDLQDLATLCGSCHEHTHKMAKKGAGYYPPLSSME